MADGGKIFLVITFFVLAIIMILVLLFSNYYKGPAIAYSKCLINGDCSYSEKCEEGYCKNLLCRKNSDCAAGLVCLNGFCSTQNCNIEVGCPTTDSALKLACIPNPKNPNENYCIPSNKISCTGGTQCYGLVCSNSVCIECLANSDCKVGQGCTGGMCYYPTSNDPVPKDNIFIPTINNEKGIFPSGYYCSSSDYGTGGVQLGCSGGSPCSKGYCVSQGCRCTPGLFFENCASGTDCASGICLKIGEGNSVCAEGPNCVFNYDSTKPGLTGSCGSSSPYCVSGMCKSDAIGAYCKKDADCPYVFSQTNVTGGISGKYYCVEGRCSANLGQIGQVCGSNLDCISYPENDITCSAADKKPYSVCRAN